MPVSVGQDSDDANVLRADAERALRISEIVVPAAAVDSAIADLAASVTAALGHADPVVMPVLVGGMFAAVRLCAHFDFPYELDRIQAGRYGRALEGGELVWSVEPGLPCGGRTVLIVDDVLDRGVTLAAARRRCLDAGAARVVTAVLVVKDVPREHGIVPDHAGVHCDDRYLFGCGMDYRGYWRGLPAVHALPRKT